jgi:hypothetical protein
MIVCNKTFLLERCVQRGYSLDEVMPCVVKREGDMWTIDETHSSYPSKSRLVINAEDPMANDQHGPGTYLSNLLKKIGIVSSPNCSCKYRIKIMNVNGNDWCENNINTIITWLKEEAKKRKLPFIDFAAELLVNRAIKLSRSAKLNVKQ